MAPELRKRKAAEAIKNNGNVKSTPKGKRKAAEEASPVSLKKQKSTKKTAIVKKATEREKSHTKEADKDEDFIAIEEDEATDSEDKDNEHIQALALEFDPEDEDSIGEEKFAPGQDVGKVPKVAKEVQKPTKTEPGVIYLGRIPHGFYEYEMRQYLSQFGEISRLYLSRNKKTGASKHFAFVEFVEANTAEIVAKTMDNYLLFGHILKCKLVPEHKMHKDLFKGANRRFKKVPWNKMAGKKLEKPLTESAWEAKIAKERSNRERKVANLKEIGYDFDAPMLKPVPAPAAIENRQVGETLLPSAPAVEDGEEPPKVLQIENISADDLAAEPNTLAKPIPTTKVAKAKVAKAAKVKKTKA